MKKGLILILTIGVFSIINTEMGVVGILPLVSENYGVTVAAAGLLVSMFALVVAVSGPTMPLFFSGVNRKKAMILVLSVFTVCNVISAFATNFPVVLITRVIPAFFQPVYVSMAMSVAGSSVPEKDAPKAVSKVMMGVSAGMVLGVPIVSYIANMTSLRVGMLFFAAVNAAALVATIIAVPDLPVKEKLSYGSQLSVLKESKTWLSIFGVMFLNGSVFGVYSYLSEYMETVTQLSAGLISILLLVYGLSNMLGNLIAGRMLSSRPLGFVVTFPFLLGAVYAVLFFLGCFTVPMAVRCSLLSGVCLPERRPISISTGLPQQRRRRLILPTVCSLHLRIWERQWELPYAVSSCQEWVLSTLYWEESSSSPALLC